MIREWFSNNCISESKNDTELSFEKLLVLYKNALCRYYQIDSNKMNSINHLISTLENRNLSKGDLLFLNFIKTKAISMFNESCSIHLPNDTQIQAHFDYDYYILEEEIKYFDYPECVRSSLISIVVEFPIELSLT